MDICNDCDTSNLNKTIDYTYCNNQFINNSRYVPNHGYIMNNYNNLLKEEEVMLVSHNEIKKNTKQNTQKLHINLAILFNQKSPNHKFGKPYLDFLTFCLSIITNPIADIDFFNMVSEIKI